MNIFRKYCRVVHRDLSYLFSGMLLIYAISGIALNHKDTYNSQYSIERKEFHVDQVTTKEEINKRFIQQWLEPHGEAINYTKHYFPEPHTVKVFLKGGSNLVVDLTTQKAVLETVKRRHVMGAMSRLHYNPGKAWTIFSDLFAVAIFVIIISGLLMIKGPKGIWGRGGIELIIGMLIPLLFLFI